MNNMTVSGFGGNGQTQTMSSREIAELCETRHNQVVETIERLFEKGVLRESRKTTRPYSPEGGGRPTQIYDLTKRDTLVIVSGYNDELRARIIDRWQELETSNLRPVLDMRDMSQLQVAALQLIEMNHEKDEKIAKLEPKADALDRLEASEGSVGPRLAAKMLNMPEKKFTSWLQSNRWAFRQNGIGPLQAYVDKRDRGYLEHRPYTYHDQARGEERTVAQMMITPKGLAKLASTLSAGHS